jgi:hypothetical protein
MKGALFLCRRHIFLVSETHTSCVGDILLCRRHILIVSETHTSCVGGTLIVSETHTSCVGDILIVSETHTSCVGDILIVSETYLLCRRHTHPESGWLFFYPSRPTCKMKTVCDRPFIKQPAFTAFFQPPFHPLYVSSKCSDVTSGWPCA